jgi:hypothetical protein
LHHQKDIEKNLGKRIDKVDQRLERMEGDVGEIKSVVVGHDKKIKKFERKAS